jgi:SAM-dependent methyltransferase
MRDIIDHRTALICRIGDAGRPASAILNGMTFHFPDGAFDRYDQAPDSEFYATPRLVTHIDDFAIGAVGEAYRRFLPPGGEYLDLMSSWVSHFPADFEIGKLVGHGMNEAELKANPKLSEYFVQDLNLDPVLPLADDRFDGVVICVSVQYLTRPVEVFREIARVLKPGAPLIVTFSNRCFPTKAVRLWQSLNDHDHGRLVALYCEQAGGFDEPNLYDLSPQRTLAGVGPDPELRRKVSSGEIASDPLFATVARKKADAA